MKNWISAALGRWLLAASIACGLAAAASPVAAQATPDTLAKWQAGVKDTYFATDVGAILRFAWENGQLVGRTEVDPNGSDDIPGRLVGTFALTPGGAYKRYYNKYSLHGAMPLPSGGTAKVVLLHDDQPDHLSGEITMPDGRERRIFWPAQTVDNALPAEHRGKPFRRFDWAEVLLTKMQFQRESQPDGTLLFVAEFAVRNKAGVYKQLVRPTFSVHLVYPDGRTEPPYRARLKPFPPNPRRLYLHETDPVALPGGGAMVRLGYTSFPTPGAKLVLMLNTGMATEISWDVPAEFTTNHPKR